jgi:hypothetical protein
MLDHFSVDRQVLSHERPLHMRQGPRSWSHLFDGPRLLVHLYRNHTGDVTA